jgi:hypothetical protein
VVPEGLLRSAQELVHASEEIMGHGWWHWLLVHFATGFLLHGTEVSDCHMYH